MRPICQGFKNHSCFFAIYIDSLNQVNSYEENLDTQKEDDALAFYRYIMHAFIYIYIYIRYTYEYLDFCLKAFNCARYVLSC